MAKRTKKEIKEILLKKSIGNTVDILYGIFSTHEELIDDIIDNHTPEQLTNGIRKSLNWDFEITEDKKDVEMG